MIVEWIEKCKECKGTGIYVGVAENYSDYGVICSVCKGSGKRHRKFEYEEFTKKEFANVNKVLEVNPGIIIGKTCWDAGGIHYIDWYNGKEFPIGSEMRNYVCPSWWFQCADYSKKPKWKKCVSGRFSDCKHFKNKDHCWKKWDEENKK